MPLSVKDELKQLDEEIRTLQKSSKVDTKAKAYVTAKLTDLINKLDNIQELKSPPAAPILKTSEPKIPKFTEVKLQPESLDVTQTGTPDKCNDCEADTCLCFSHLSKPAIIIKSNGNMSITFNDDFSPQDKLNYLKYMKMAVQKKRKDRLPGGIGDKTDPSKLDPKELSEGKQHEKEHTSNPEIAEEIAIDHLTEDPKYYTHLDENE
jgi:hypothetical protein